MCFKLTVQKYLLEDHHLVVEEEVVVEEVVVEEVEALWGGCLLVGFLVYLARLVQLTTEVSAGSFFIICTK